MNTNQYQSSYYHPDSISRSIAIFDKSKFCQTQRVQKGLYLIWKSTELLPAF